MKRRLLTVLLSVLMITPAATVHLKQKTVRADEETPVAAENVPVEVSEDVQIPIDEVHFSDKNFREYLLKIWDTAEPKGVLTYDELENITEMSPRGWGIESFRGIEYLSFLKSLDISDMSFGDLDLRGNSELVELEIWHNKRKFKIDCTGLTKLESVEITNSELCGLELKGCVSLKELSCGSSADLEVLDLSDCASLQTLKCQYCYSLKKLDVSGCTALKYLDCNHHYALRELDVSSCEALEYLNCSEWHIEKLVLGNHPELAFLNCASNDLTYLDVSKCPKLEQLNCRENKISEFKLKHNPKLRELRCDGNFVSEITIYSSPLLLELEKTVKNPTKDSYKHFGTSDMVEYYDYQANLKDGDGNDVSCRLSVDVSDTLITEAPVYPITISADKNGAASASAKSAAEFDVVTLTATPKENYQLKEWQIISGSAEIADVHSADTTFIMGEGAVEIKAVFEKIPRKITVTTDGDGIATASVDAAPSGTKVTLTATPSEGSSFKEWQVVRGGVVLSDAQNATASFSVCEADVEIKAIFVKIPRSITVTSSGNGTASASVTSGVLGDTVILTAAPDEGYQFKQWQVVSGGVVLADAKSATTTFTVALANVEIKAVFEQVPPAPQPGQPGDPAQPQPGKEGSFEDFVERLYVVALGRPSEAEGKAFWVDQVVNKGFTGADCARFFMLGAPEFLGRGLTDDEFVEVLYKTYFDRDSEADGKAYWLGRLASGTERAVLVEEFIESVEWCNVCAGYGVKSGAKYHKATVPSKNAVKFATRLYTCCLGRDPEAEGLEYWALALTNLEYSGYEAAKGFFESDEFVGKNVDDTTYVKLLYRTFMGRDFDQSGLEFWLGHLATDMNRLQVLQGFAQSQEFTNICNEYGIDRGTI